jgi:hypothetical protein
MTRFIDKIFVALFKRRLGYRGAGVAFETVAERVREHTVGTRERSFELTLYKQA